eukprot:TRINITY_DN12617_c0_g1_i1.p3 TRINITY_DN12617_c0_g1~~TRINITY_DN12617_c0_g1_i1.p3  ORF type:complete len:102 (-),score=4.20 TRINITY_DN12617_c0_g1_i1:720-1025(-)
MRRTPAKAIPDAAPGILRENLCFRSSSAIDLFFRPLKSWNWIRFSIPSFVHPSYLHLHTFCLSSPPFFASFVICSVFACVGCCRSTSYVSSMPNVKYHKAG